MASSKLGVVFLMAAVQAVGAAGLDPINNFCSRWYHQSQVKNDILFIDGGIASFSEREPFDNYADSATGKPAAHDDRLDYTGPVVTGTNIYTITVDLRTSWNWKTNISEVPLNKSVSSGTSNLVPIVQSGALFHGLPDDPHIYLYGGATPDINTSFANWQRPTTSQYTLWGLNTDTNDWTQHDVFLDAPERPSWGASAEAPEHGLAFYLNGLRNNMSSATTYSSNVAPSNLGGLVVLDLNDLTVPPLIIDSAFNMGEVDIFNVEAATQSNSSSSNIDWASQKTQGDVPDPRVDFCTTIVAAPDNSSFNIYMYGGWDPTQNQALDEIWVYEGTLPRFGHTCHLVGGRQMITIGGTNLTNYPTNCDWEWMSVAILDLTEMAWGSIYDSNKAPYQVNHQISTLVGGGSDGAATKLLPDGGWTSSMVAQLFTGTTNQSAPYSPSGAISSSNPSTGSDSGVNIGAIVGGTVGGAVLVALLGLQLWWLRRRRRQRQRAAAPEETKPAPAMEQQHREEIAGEPVIELPANEYVSEMQDRSTWLSELPGSSPGAPKMQPEFVSPNHFEDPGSKFKVQS
ncbi:putative Peptidase A1 domain-containing protein [Seiridium cardinale]|uniref:Peptidase A1 domain-containing protein n=1 Tax=Seiridium cardinale TaxID=138064 RepID=A0ABR2XE08_9PEZI